MGTSYKIYCEFSSTTKLSTPNFIDITFPSFMRCYTIIYTYVGYSVITFLIDYNGNNQKLPVAYDVCFILFQVIHRNFSKSFCDVYKKFDVISNFDFKPNPLTHISFSYAKQVNFLHGII